GFREVEGDSLTIIKKLRVPVEDRLAISVLIKEIRVRAQNFDSVEYSFIPRQGYSAAHTLAVECWRFEGPRVWIEEALVVVETEADRDQRVMN
ncbi:hypothetical protein Godav_018874, partial [Gossypium davidsonii]|nr:hypothetical protein [Gossypium davidsonii]